MSEQNKGMNRREALRAMGLGFGALVGGTLLGCGPEGCLPGCEKHKPGKLDLGSTPDSGSSADMREKKGLFWSDFFKNNAEAERIMNGESYDINDPQGLDKETFAYKLFSAFTMLGYNADICRNVQGTRLPHILLLQQFKNSFQLGSGSMVTKEVLAKMDELLAANEVRFRDVGSRFPLYDKMEAQHPNGVSKDYVATLYQLPFEALPEKLRLSAQEMAFCISGQCRGNTHDAAGKDTRVTDINMPFSFDPLILDSEGLPYSASTITENVLHEYGHYLDGFLYDGSSLKHDFPQFKHMGMLDSAGFYGFNYKDIDKISGCAELVNNTPQAFISKYGYTMATQACPRPGGKTIRIGNEEFAEVMQVYVKSGKQFRMAATKNKIIRQQYQWLKDNVFGGVEYDTDLSQLGVAADLNHSDPKQPGYLQWRPDDVWDFELKKK